MNMNYSVKKRKPYTVDKRTLRPATMMQSDGSTDMKKKINYVDCTLYSSGDPISQSTRHFFSFYSPRNIIRNCHTVRQKPKYHVVKHVGAKENVNEKRENFQCVRDTKLIFRGFSV